MTGVQTCALPISKVKKNNNLKVELLTALITHLLPLADFFTSDFSFLILPDVIFNNTSIPFL